MAEFCSDDPRLIGVALLPLDEPEKIHKGNRFRDI